MGLNILIFFNSYLGYKFILFTYSGFRLFESFLYFIINNLYANYMAVSRQKKEEALKKAGKIFKDAKSSVLVKFSKVEGNEIKEFRFDLNQNDVKYTVIKKTLIKKAANDSKIKGSIPDLTDGEIALAYSFEEEIIPAQKVKEWSKKFKGRMEIAGGVFENEFKNKAEMTEIADIPTLDVLRGMFVNVINSPIQRMVIALDQITKKNS